MNLDRVGFGVTGNLDLDLVRWLAPRVEEAGFQTLWFNDTAGGNSLERVAIAAQLTSRIRLGTGVIPFDRRPAADIVADLRALGIPEDRLLLGVGSGGHRERPIAFVREGIATLRHLTSARIIVGALGPQMRRLGAQVGDGILLNWLTPETAALARDEMNADAISAERPAPELVTYVRTGIGEASIARVHEEAAKYSQIPGYAANFARLGITAVDASICATTPEEVRQGLARYEGTVGEVVVRAITPTDAQDEYAALIDAIVG